MTAAAHVTLRRRAIHDADSAFDYLKAEAPPGTADNFVDALERALSHLARYPLTGSLRFAFELDIPNLRTWSLDRFPYLIFYVANNDHIDVWRILHTNRDIPPSLGDDQRGPSRR